MEPWKSDDTSMLGTAIVGILNRTGGVQKYGWVILCLNRIKLCTLPFGSEFEPQDTSYNSYIAQNSLSCLSA